MVKFDKPLDTFIEEDIEIPSFEPVVNEKEKRVEFKQTTRKATRKTYYAHSKPQRVVCAGGTHKFRCIDKGKYVFKCINCDWHRILYPVTYKFDEKTGIATHRITRARI